MIIEAIDACIKGYIIGCVVIPAIILGLGLAKSLFTDK